MQVINQKSSKANILIVDDMPDNLESGIALTSSPRR